MYRDAYAHLYQQSDGFRIKVKAPKNKTIQAYLSLKPSTRSTYDIAMRDATIDGLLTAGKEDIDKIKPSQIFYKENNPNELFILQSINSFELQYNTRNIHAIKQNTFVTVQRLDYDTENDKEYYRDVYTDLISFVSMMTKDEKNFAAGVEDTTNINIQIPKRDIDGKIYEIHNQDRILLSNIQKDYTMTIKVESIDALGVPGVIRIYGTSDTGVGE